MPLLNTAIPNPSPIAVPQPQQAPNTVSPQGTMQAAPMAATPAPNPTPSAPAGGGGFDLPSFVQQARQQGVPDAQIFQHLHDNGMIPTNAVVQQGQQPQGAQLTDTGSFGGNVANSAGQFIGGVASAVGNIFNPDMSKNTVANIGGVLKGAAEVPLVLAWNALTGKKPGEDGGAYVDSPQFQAFTQAMGQRYGSLDAIKKTAYQDPIGFVADVATLASGAGEALTAAGDASKISSLSRIGEGVTTAANAANPINLVTKPIELTASLAKAGLENLAPALEKSNLRLTPADSRKFQDFIKPATDYIAENFKAAGPEAKHAEAIDKIETIENTFKSWLDESGVGSKTFDTQHLIDEANKIKSEFRTSRDSLSINNQIDNFTKTIETNWPEGQMSVSDLNELKRSTFKNAFNSAGFKVSDVVEYKLADKMYDGLKNLTQDTPVMGKYPIQDFNKAYQVAIKAEQMLKASVGRPQVGFTERLLLDAIGFGISGPGGGFVAHVASNYLPVTATKSVLGKAATLGSKLIPKIKIPAGASSAITAGTQINTKAKGK